MKHFKTVESPATTRKIEDFITCDLCGNKIEDPGNFKIDEVEVYHKTGESYPEGGSGEEARVDMCGKCFDDKLIPWLKSQGCETKMEGWDW